MCFVVNNTDVHDAACYLTNIEAETLSNKLVVTLTPFIKNELD
jgi:hypothetical protein